MELREWLFKNRVTSTDLSKQIGVSRTHLNLIVNGQRRPSPELAKKIEKATDGQVTVMELLFPERYK